MEALAAGRPAAAVLAAGEAMPVAAAAGGMLEINKTVRIKSSPFLVRQRKARRIF